MKFNNIDAQPTPSDKYIYDVLELRQYKKGLVSVKSMFVLKLPPFLPHLHGKGKKGGHFKNSMRFTETNPFLYCLSSNKIDPDFVTVKGVSFPHLGAM